MSQRVPKTPQLEIIGLVVFLLMGWIPGSVCRAGDQSIRHEIHTGIQWRSYDYTSGHYIINGEAVPLVSSRFKRDYQQISSSYSFFFTPLTENEDIPIALQWFYAHPTTLQVSFSLQPEDQTTYTFQNLQSDYRAFNFKDMRSRGTGLQFGYYVRNNTGLLFSLSSTKNEEDLQNSTNLGHRGSGENNEMKRSYGFGISQFFSEAFHLKGMYTLFDAEYVTIEKTWQTDTPLLALESGTEADADGQNFSFMLEYIWEKFLKIHGMYTFEEQQGHSNVFSLYYNELPDSTLYFDDEITAHVFAGSLSLHIGSKATIHAGGSLARQTQERVYESDQINEYTWDITKIGTGISYYLNRHIGVQIEYAFTQWDCDVLTWHPETTTDPRTEFEVHADSHVVQLGITGRF